EVQYCGRRSCRSAGSAFECAARGEALGLAQQRLLALDDGYVDHLALESDSADAAGDHVVVGGDHALGAVDGFRGDAIFLVEHMDDARVDAAGGGKAELARTAYNLAKDVEVPEVGHRP